MTPPPPSHFNSIPTRVLLQEGKILIWNSNHSGLHGTQAVCSIVSRSMLIKPHQAERNKTQSVAFCQAFAKSTSLESLRSSDPSCQFHRDRKWQMSLVDCNEIHIDQASGPVLKRVKCFRRCFTYLYIWPSWCPVCQWVQECVSDLDKTPPVMWFPVAQPPEGFFFLIYLAWLGRKMHFVCQVPK